MSDETIHHPGTQQEPPIIEFGLQVANLLRTKFPLLSLYISSLSASIIVPQPVKEIKLDTGPPSTAMIKEILAAHNKYRLEFGVPPLRWSDALAEHALGWANQLAAENAFRHDMNRNRHAEGESIWMGRVGYYTYNNMIDAFGGEKQYYIPGVFPDVSKTGNSRDVGHYTQMVWPTTTHVGCAGAIGSDGYL